MKPQPRNKIKSSKEKTKLRLKKIFTRPSVRAYMCTKDEFIDHICVSPVFYETWLRSQKLSDGCRIWPEETSVYLFSEVKDNGLSLKVRADRAAYWMFRQKGIDGFDKTCGNNLCVAVEHIKANGKHPENDTNMHLQSHGLSVENSKSRWSFPETVTRTAALAFIRNEFLPFDFIQRYCVKGTNGSIPIKSKSWDDAHDKDFREAIQAGKEPSICYDLVVMRSRSIK